MQKGLSDIIAVVILVGFVIALAIVAGNFIFDFARSQTSSIREEGKTTVPCSLAVLEIDTASINNQAGTLRVTVLNRGRTDFKTVSLVYTLTGSGSFTSANLSAPLAAGEIKTLNVTGVTSTVDRIIATTDCPGVGDTVSNQSGTFKRAL